MEVLESILATSSGKMTGQTENQISELIEALKLRRLKTDHSLYVCDSPYMTMLTGEYLVFFKYIKITTELK